MKKIYAILTVTLLLLANHENLFSQSYCIPGYSSACSSGDYIDIFTTTGGTTNINNSFSGCNGNPNNYIDLSATQILTIAPGGTFNFTCQSGSSWDQGFTVWIDYNDNGSFADPGENAWNSGISSTALFSGSINVPLTATGITMMRVRCTWASIPADPCATYTFGETEDYGVVFCTVPTTPTVTSPISSCVGGAATLNASGSTGTLTWYDVASGGTALGTGTSFVTPTFTVAGPDTFWVAGENGGCSSPRIPIYVNVSSAVNVALGADTTVCGSSFTLDAGYPGSTFLWSTGQGTQTINITTSGTYSVNLITPIGCSGSDQIVVNLNTPPNYTLGNDTSTCGSNIVLDAGGGYNSYAWSTGDTTQLLTVNSNDTLGVTVTDVNGCVLTDSIIVTLSPSPVVNIGPDTTQCGGSVVLDAGNPGNLYFWSNSTSSQTTSVSTSGIYSVMVLTQAGCSASDTAIVTINYQPVVDLGADTSICLASVLLDAGNPGSTYVWSNSQTSQTVTVGTGTYSVLVTDPSGCFDSDTITVTTNIPPNVTVSQDTAICPGGSATLNASGALTYLWSNNSTANPLTVTPTNSTSYYVTGTDANGCQASDVVIVTILPTATPMFTATVVGATAVITNQSTGAFTYSWNFGDASPLVNSQNPTHTYTVNGTYTITLTVTDACGTSTYTQVVTISEVGIEDADLANSLSIYPNPNDGHFTVSFEFAEAKDVTITLTDVSGRVIAKESEQDIMTYNHEFGNEELANGIYFITISTQAGSVTRRVSVQR